MDGISSELVAGQRTYLVAGLGGGEPVFQLLMEVGYLLDRGFFRSDLGNLVFQLASLFTRPDTACVDERELVRFARPDVGG